MSGPPLPQPDSEQLVATVPDAPARTLYQLLHRRRGPRCPSLVEAQLFLTTSFGSSSILDTALSKLDSIFLIDRVRDGGEARLQLVGWADLTPTPDPPISRRLRAEVLASQRCEQCGKTPREHGVRLEPEFRLPPAWGGVAEPGNLQPLCEECSKGWREYLGVHLVHGREVERAANFDEPQKRLGELLRAFDGAWVRSDLLEMVASAKEYQEDWQRRLRELRDLGWEYAYRKTGSEGARVRTYYRLTRSAPWPENISAVLKAKERRRKAARKRQPSN